jgi:hypothetical protein
MKKTIPFGNAEDLNREDAKLLDNNNLLNLLGGG